jgi:hypothetical protein
LFFSHSRHPCWACLCSATGVATFREMRPSNALTDSGARSPFREFPTEPARTGRDSGLCRRIRLGILHSADRGKPVERRGRKATGLQRGAMTAGLPAGRMVFEKNRAGLVITKGLGLFSSRSAGRHLRGTHCLRMRAA